MNIGSSPDVAEEATSGMLNKRIRINLLTVVEAMNSLEHTPRESAWSWAQMLKAVSTGCLYPLKTNSGFYRVLRMEPEVCRKILPFLHMTGSQGKSLSQAHSDPLDCARRRKDLNWRITY